MKRYLVSSLLVLIIVITISSRIEAQTWTHQSTLNTPSTRYGSTAVYDNTNNIMVLFGGNNGSNVNEVWTLSTANGLSGITSAWAKSSTAGGPPTVRRYHSAIYDNTNNIMTIFGGDNGGNRNDVWTLSTANALNGATSVWTQSSTIGGPPSARNQHTAVYDATNNLMIIFGGQGVSADNDVWTLSTANGLGNITSAWTQLSPTGTPPTARYGHSAVYDSTNNLMIVFGGSNGGYLNDVWVLSTANGVGGTPHWTQLSPTGTAPSARYLHTAVYDATNNLMTIFGGYNGSNALSDTWVLSTANGKGGTPAWSQSSAVTGPVARYTHTAVYDSANNRMTIFGGLNNGSTSQNDTWVLQNADEVPVELSNFYIKEND